MFLTLFISFILFVLTIAVVFISLIIIIASVIPSPDTQYTDPDQPEYTDGLAQWQFQES